MESAASEEREGTIQRLGGNQLITGEQIAQGCGEGEGYQGGRVSLVPTIQKVLVDRASRADGEPSKRKQGWVAAIHCIKLSSNESFASELDRLLGNDVVHAHSKIGVGLIDHQARSQCE